MLNIVLYEPLIPGNTGNIMRTCAGTNTYLHLIKPLGFSLDDKYIKRSGVNYLDKCNYKIYENIENFYKENKGTYYYLTRYGKKTHSSFDYSNKDENIYFILGSETNGIPKEILKNNLNFCMRIPMNENIRALNLSNAASIIIYEALRQREYPNLKTYEPHKSKDLIYEN